MVSSFFDPPVNLLSHLPADAGVGTESGLDASALDASALDGSGPNKMALRRGLLQQRRSLSVEEWRSRSQRVCDHVAHQGDFQRAQTVLAYFSTAQEPDLRTLWQAFPEKTWGFPRCVGQGLHWHCWRPGEAIAVNRYGIDEPLATAPLLRPEQVELILVPAVGCDRQGYRLGYGGGFYDRLFADPAWGQCCRLGITFSFAVKDGIPRDPWDQALHGVCTDAGVLRVLPCPAEAVESEAVGSEAVGSEAV